MKFSLESNLDFEAVTRDEALLKLALHFLSLMDYRPPLVHKGHPPMDVLGTLIKNMPSLSGPATNGYIDVDVHGDFPPPELLQ